MPLVLKDPQGDCLEYCIWLLNCGEDIRLQCPLFRNALQKPYVSEALSTPEPCHLLPPWYRPAQTRIYIPRSYINQRRRAQEWWAECRNETKLEAPTSFTRLQQLKGTLHPKRQAYLMPTLAFERTLYQGQSCLDQP